MPNDDVKVLREAAFACTIRYANTHMSTNDRLYFDAIKICFNRMADMIERKERELTFTHEQINERDTVIADEAWDAAIEACAEFLTTHIPAATRVSEDPFVIRYEIISSEVKPGTPGYAWAEALRALRREPRP